MARPKPKDDGNSSPLRWLATALAAVLLVSVLQISGAFQFVERELIDLRFKLLTHAASDDLVVVEIDPQSLQALAVWPWPRSFHAEVIDRLVEAGAELVAFDIDFSSPSSPETDARLEAALARADGRVVLPVFQQYIVDSEGPQVAYTGPLDRFRRHVDVASINVRPAADGLVRRMSLSEIWAGEAVPSLAALLADRNDAELEPFLVDFSIDPAGIPRLSFVDVYEGRFDPDAVRGKKIVIGATAVELQDVMPVPVHMSIPGVLLHSLGYQSLAQDRDLRTLATLPTILLSLGLALLLAPLFRHLSWRGGLLLAGTAVLGLAALALAVQATLPIVVEVTQAMALVVLLYAAALVSRVNRQSLSLIAQSLMLHKANSVMRGIVDNSFDGIVTFRADGVIETANESAHRIFQAQNNCLTGLPVADLLPVGALDSQGVLFAPGRRETTGLRGDGSSFPLELAVSETQVGDEQINIAVLRDITDRKQQEAKLEHQALHDDLTGLPNRTLLFDRLTHALKAARRRRGPLAILLIDLDHFKTINDTLGHAVGDALLCEVASRLGAQLRESDTIARLGGDEFAVLLPAPTDLDSALDVSGRLIQALRAPFEIEGLSLELGMSVGVALYPEHADETSKLIQCADVAMYMAKQARSGTEVYDEEKDVNSVRHLTLTGELRRAIEERQLAMVFQPKIDIASGRVCGAEALARWNHAELGFIPPDEFIEQAERTGLIQPLTLWALETAVQRAVAWRKQGYELNLAVNLSTRNLQDRGLPDLLAKLLAEHSLDAGCLTLEITESAMMADPEGALEVVRAFHALGVRLAVDDFGTGHSSLAYLSQLPLHELKVDKSFVMQMIENETDALIVRSTIELAHSLGLKVVAEGIESDQHLEILRGLACDVGQGFGISRPLAPADFDSWLHEWDSDKAGPGGGQDSSTAPQPSDWRSQGSLTR